jgi:hypothetical protein
MATARETKDSTSAPAYTILDGEEKLQEAIQTKDRYVLIYAHIGEMNPIAGEYVCLFGTFIMCLQLTRDN